MSLGKFEEDNLLEFREKAFLKYAFNEVSYENFGLEDVRRALVDRLKQRFNSQNNRRINSQRPQQRNNRSNNERNQPQVREGKLCQRPDGSTYGIPRNRECVSGREISAPRQQANQGTGVRPMTPEEIRDSRGDEGEENLNRGVRPPTSEELRSIRRRNLIPRLKTAIKNRFNKERLEESNTAHIEVLELAEEKYRDQLSELNKLTEGHRGFSSEGYSKALEQMASIRNGLLSRGANEEAKEKADETRFIIGNEHYHSKEWYKNRLPELYAISNNKVETLGSIENPIFRVDRAYAMSPFLGRNGSIAMSPNNTDSRSHETTFWHEFGHHVEFSNPEVYQASMSWVRSRATSEQPQSLNSLVGTDYYRKNEVALPGNFFSPYVGKVYPGGGKYKTTEAFSMGFQHFHSPEAMVKFYERDPEHFQLIVGILSTL